MNKKVRLDRLRKLKFILDNHTRIFENVNFNMSVFFLDVSCKVGKRKCNSAACALGSAALYPSFRKAGLRLNKYNNVIYKCNRNYKAGEIFFGISESESLYLFSPITYLGHEKITRKIVSNRVSSLINTYESEL